MFRKWRKSYNPDPVEHYHLTDEWYQLRIDTLFRDNFRCLRCNLVFDMDGLDAHHLIPRSVGGANDISNLVTLCTPCHDIVETLDFRTRTEIIASMDGDDIDHSQPTNKRTRRSDNRSDWHARVYGKSKK